MDRLRLEGVAVWIVSASPQGVVEPTLDYFDIERDGVVAVRNTIDGQALLTAYLQEPLPIYGGKVASIQELIHTTTPPLMAAGDSGNDQWMLDYAGIQVVIPRGNSLEELARERGWLLLQ